MQRFRCELSLPSCPTRISITQLLLSDGADINIVGVSTELHYRQLPVRGKGDIFEAERGFRMLARASTEMGQEAYAASYSWWNRVRTLTPRPGDTKTPLNTATNRINGRWQVFKGGKRSGGVEEI
jgi:hypothetical protein